MSNERSILCSRVIEFAKSIIEEQEGSPAVVKDWSILDGYLHLLTVSVILAIEKSQFEVWVYADLGTGEIRL